jgi:L-ribulose-5-phosphate 3-epimerase
MKTTGYNIGVMQGRLLPKYMGRYQAHPVGYWQEEFYAAAGLGLDCVEFILDFNDSGLNPLMDQAGIEAIRAVSEKTGVTVRSVCADYFMEAPIHSNSGAVAADSLNVLLRLLESVSPLGVRDVVVPCVDQSSLLDERSWFPFVRNIRPAVERAESLHINISLETDLPPDLFGKLLDLLKSPVVTVNYDTGNSASLGYDPLEELAAYGARISDIHIKDRVRGGGSVELGTGDTDFKAFFSELSKFEYTGPFIMQACRDDEGVEIFKRQLKWIRPYIDGWFANAFSQRPECEAE